MSILTLSDLKPRGFGYLRVSSKLLMPMYNYYIRVHLQISLIYPVYSNATIKSLTDCELFVINRDALREVLYFHPESELRVCVCVCVCACVRACVRACVCTCVCMRIIVNVCTYLLIVADSLRNSIQMSVRRLFDHDIFC